MNAPPLAFDKILLYHIGYMGFAGDRVMIPGSL